MPKTYEPIATTTLGSNASSYTFSSIPATYTDLILVANGVALSVYNWNMQFNGDTGNNYSNTGISGNGSSASSSRDTSQPYMWLGAVTSTQGATIFQIMNYANTTTNKTVLCRSNYVSTGVSANVGLWRSTAAINSITISYNSAMLQTGSTFTLYGIKAA
jgi:hypothetical protein